MRSSTVRAALVLLVTFAAGAAAGMAADRLWLDAPETTAEAPEEARVERAEEPGDRGEEHREKEKRDDRPKTTIQRFADELGLTSDQRSRIEEILSRHREEMHEMWSEVRPRFRSLMDSARADIESVLTEEQTEQYRRLLEREHGEDERWDTDDDEPSPDREPGAAESGADTTDGR
jgi:Spy/CpxP family protein refolding chaperone